MSHFASTFTEANGHCEPGPSAKEIDVSHAYIKAGAVSFGRVISFIVGVQTCVLLYVIRLYLQMRE